MNLFFFPSRVQKALLCFDELLWVSIKKPEQPTGSLASPPPSPCPPSTLHPQLLSSPAAPARSAGGERAERASAVTRTARPGATTRRVASRAFVSGILRTTPAGGLARLSLALGMWTTALG